MHQIQATTRAYITILLCLAAVLTAVVLTRAPLLRPATVIAAIVAAACMAAAWLFPIRFAPRTKVYVDTAVVVAAVLLLPPALAAIAAGTGTLAAHVLRRESRDMAQALFNAAQAMLVTLAAALILALAGWNPLQPVFSPARLLLVLPIVAVAMYLLNVFFVAAITALQGAQPIIGSFRVALGEDFKVEALAHASLVATGLLAAMIAGAYRWGIVLLAIPIVAIHLTLQHQARSRHAAERARVMSDAGLAEAQRLARLGSWEWHPDTDRWIWSDEVYRLLGQATGMAPPTSDAILDQIPPPDHARVEQVFQEARHGRRPFDVEHRLRLPDGSERFMHQRATPREGNGHGHRFLGTIQDVTERVLAEEAMRQAKEAAQEADRAKSHLLSMASHDLRTPLTAIQGYLEIVIDGSAGEINAEQQEFLQTAHRNTLHLAALVNDLLDLARIEAGHLSLRPRPVDVDVAVAQLVQTLTPQARAKGISLEARPCAGRPLAQADPARLDQMLQNLLGNAIKFTEQGGVTVTIAADSAWVEIAVTDTGIGIPPDALPQIFEEFSQGGEEARRQGGAGLGLAIVKQFAELHGGGVSVTSAPGRGSTFTLRLPAAVASSEEIPEVATPAAETSAP